MGVDFRAIEGGDTSFELSDFKFPNFDCGILGKRKGCYIISSPTRQIEYAKALEEVDSSASCRYCR